VRTAFHDAVARFGESARPRAGVLIPSSAVDRTTSDTPVARRTNRPCPFGRSYCLAKPRPIHHPARERLDNYPGPERLRPLCAADHSTALERCNTTRDQVAPANSRILARDRFGSAPDRVAPCCFRFDRSAARAEHDSSDVDRRPLHRTQGCTRERSVASVKLRATHAVRRDQRAPAGSGPVRGYQAPFG